MAQPVSRAGEELRLAPTAEEGIGAVLGGLLGGTRDATIARVLVREESDVSLVVEVEARGFGGRRLRGEIKDKSRQAMPLVSQAVAEIPAGESAKVKLEFKTQPATGGAGAAGSSAVPESTEFDSAYLTLRLDGTVPTQVTYRLAKHWLMNPLPQDVLVRAVARPEGAAALLPATETGTPALPQRRIRLLTEAVVMTPAAQPAAPASEAPRTREDRRRPIEATAATAVAPATVAAAATPAALTAVDLRAVRMVAVSNYHFGLDRQTTDRGGRGPGTATLDLLEGLRSDVELPREALTRVASQLFQDLNAASGVVYFMPESFALAWNADNGYALRMLYGASTDGAAGEVRMSATLSAGVDTSEIRLARELLLAYQRRHPQVQFSELRPLPIGAVPSVSLGGALSSTYDIPSDRIVVNAISDALAGVDLAWNTDPVTKENLQLALAEDVGLNGTVTLSPVGGLTAQSVPVRIRLADTRTFGALEWQRDMAWRNRTPYPARLKYLHVLLIDQNVPVIYSWNLGGIEVPPQARVEIDAARVPAWLDRKALRSWIDYVPLSSCESCDREVLRAVTGGVTSLTASQITFHTITPLADTGAYEISLEVRSRLFDARTRDLVTKPVVVLKEDGKDYEVGPIYVPAQGDREGPLFEYRLELARPDGSTTRGVRWIASDRLRLLIGKVQVDEALAASP